MNLIQNLAQLKANLETLENYLNSLDFKEKEYAKERIKKGTCFVAYVQNGAYRFAPSRFIGYENNSIDNHEKNEEKDGRLTNPQIEKILDKKVTENASLEKEYRKYCSKLGITCQNTGSFGVKRKYWELCL
jgi:hypothetical protein